MPLAYLPGGLTRLRLKVVGQLAGAAPGPATALKLHMSEPLPEVMVEPDSAADVGMILIRN